MPANTPETPTMTAEDAGALMASASRECSRLVDPAQIRRILATYHALAAAREECQKQSDINAELVPMVNRLRDELSAAREDSARLDWLERRRRVARVQSSDHATGWGPQCAWLFADIASRFVDGDDPGPVDLRSVIDAARSTDAERRGTE